MSSLWIINKAGGLVYQANHFQALQHLTSNEYLILAGTLHGIHAITARLNPVSGKRTSGLETLDADGFRMTVLLTATGELTLLFISLYALLLCDFHAFENGALLQGAALRICVADSEGL